MRVVCLSWIETTPHFVRLPFSLFRFEAMKKMELAPSGCRCFAKISRSCEVPVPICSQPLRLPRLWSRIGRRSQTVVRLLPQTVGIVVPPHLGQQQLLHLRELIRVARVGGKVHLM